MVRLFKPSSSLTLGPAILSLCILKLFLLFSGNNISFVNFCFHHFCPVSAGFLYSCACSDNSVNSDGMLSLNILPVCP